MRILDIALKDLLQIVRDWKSFLFLLAMPIAFTLVFGFAFGGFESDDDQADMRLPVAIIDQDNGQFSPILLELLEKSDVIRPEIITEELSIEDMNEKVSDDDYAALIIIPHGYSAAMLDDEPVCLTTILKEDTSAGATAQNAIQAVVNRLVNAIGAAQFGIIVQENREPFGDQSARDEFFARALDQAVTAWDNPPFTVVSTQTGAGGDQQNGGGNAFTHSSPGMMVQFAIAGLIGAAEILVLERKSGSLKRLLTTATSRRDIVLGHFLAMFLMIFTQIAILIIFAQVFLDVPYLRAPLATLLVALATALFTGSMGLLIGTLAKKPEQAVVFSLIPMFILSGLGGAWVPLEFTSETFQTIGHFTPIAWAMDGFQNIIMRGMGLESVWLPVLVLLGFALALFSLSIWRFKFE